jgi:hypothetical protein
MHLAQESGQVWVRTLQGCTTCRSPGNRRKSAPSFEMPQQKRTGLGPHPPTLRKSQKAQKSREIGDATAARSKKRTGLGPHPPNVRI